MNVTRSAERFGRALGVVVMCSAMAQAAPPDSYSLLTGQQVTAAAGAPSFDVASVRPTKTPEGSSGWNSTPEGSLRMQNQSLKALIRIAYGVTDDRIAGGPKWLNSDRYNIEAKAPGPAQDAQLLLMLQQLLSDRFKLVVHKETRQMSGLALVTAKAGLKIKPVQPSGNNQMDIRGGHMIAKGVSMAKVAETLSHLVGFPVLDETQASGVFDFNLDWSPDASQPNPAGETSTGDSLYSALQDQLGLRLEARKIPVEVIVVDQAEKPSAN